ncbi:beta-ribofuranosylaminobenzene 5'-phosphate synthase family protein [Mucilaginibacter sp.]|uniref:beta-ribofuranosylaminobenzene 5'-phosphate synthase family protein n=1 Tax=Mucilaginibacter sp. TaxID=1882438 RepID=UPI0032663785
MSGVRVVKIKTFARLHIALIAMSKKGYRVNGGFGFSIDYPALNIEIKNSDEFIFKDNREMSTSQQEIDRHKNKIEFIKKKYGIERNLAISVSGSLQSHSGFGSGTAIRLAIIEGLFLLNDISVNNDQLTSYSGRGGTSGIGVRTYFEGGYVFDVGKKNKKEHLLPSSSLENNPKQSLIIAQGKMPNWNFGICIPNKVKGLSNIQEVNFFKTNALLSNEEVHKVVYEVVFGLVASIKELDKETFSSAIKKIQTSGWKKAERSIYKGEIELYEQILYNAGAKCVGMSSLGPCLFFTSDDVVDLIEKLRSKMPNCELFASSSKNSGRTIIIDNA